MTTSPGVITIAARLTLSALAGTVLLAGCSSHGAPKTDAPATGATSAPPTSGASVPAQPPPSSTPPPAPATARPTAPTQSSAVEGAAVSDARRPCPSKPGEACVTGTIFYRERMALPPAATIKLQLADVSLADAPAKVIDEYAFTSGGKQPPFDVALRYDPAAMDDRHEYAVQARIELDGTLMFINDTRTSVITRGNPTTVNIMLVRVKSPAP